MLSVILYGRNDNHGYNYHKRMAISLNCIAEMLSDPHDEILFADYNSPDDFSTIVEALQDTLTDKAKSLIKVFRIRPSHHQRFLKTTHLPVLEALARNVAIRRSNPENKWILSTNSDMIFIPLGLNDSLTSIVAKLPDGFYSLPRFALPENFWEVGLERLNPESNISFLRGQSEKFHLNSVFRQSGFLKYDNPGDFQLILRQDIFQIRGFDEEMRKGWHVDANLCKRMALLGRDGESLEKQLMAFHCNHNQKESLVHDKITENDWHRFITHVKSSILSAENWGLADEMIEEIYLKNRNLHIHATSHALSNFPKKTYEFTIHPDSFNTFTYSPSRIFPFLSDCLCNLNKAINIAYIGYNIGLINILNTYLDQMGFSGKILCLKNCIESDGKLPPSAILSEMEEIISQAYLFICDFGFDENSSIAKNLEKQFFGRKKLKKVMNAFFEILNKKKRLGENAKFIGINVLHTDFSIIFAKHLAIRNNGYASGLCYGYYSWKNKNNRFKFSAAFTKNNVKSTLYYLIVRYFFKYSGKIRSFLSRSAVSKRLFKSLG